MVYLVSLVLLWMKLDEVTLKMYRGDESRTNILLPYVSEDETLVGMHFRSRNLKESCFLSN